MFPLLQHIWRHDSKVGLMVVWSEVVVVVQVVTPLPRSTKSMVNPPATELSEATFDKPLPTVLHR